MSTSRSTRHSRYALCSIVPPPQDTLIATATLCISLVPFQEADDWLDLHLDASKAEVEERRAELEAIVNPIVKLAYERAGVDKPGGGDEYDDLDSAEEL